MTVSKLSLGDVREVALGRVRAYWASNRNGWLSSHMSARPVDQNDDPIPWITYACRYFLEQRVRSSMRLFEYGSGNSTVYWSRRLETVVSCEHDETFYNEIKPKLPDNVTYLLHPDEESYVNAATKQDAKFDLIVIDGYNPWRSSCAVNSIRALSDTGVFIWDNTDMKRVADGLNAVQNAGFRRLDFRSHGPIWAREWITSIFYRADNCLGV